MQNSGKVIAEVLLGMSLLSFSFPSHTQDISNTISNSSSFFITPMQIKKDDNLSTVNFKDIFGSNPTDENTTVVSQNQNKEMTLKILNFEDDFVAILKIGDKSLLLNSGKAKNRVTLMETLGRMQISKLDAVIITDINESTENLFTLAELGIVKKILLPGIQLNKNTSDFNLVEKLKDTKKKLEELNTNVQEIYDQTNINFAKATLKTILPEGSSSISLLIENNENTILLQGDLTQDKQKDIILPLVNTYIVQSKFALSKDYINKVKPEKVLLVERKDSLLSEDSKKQIQEIVGKDNLFNVNSTNGFSVVLPPSSSKFEIKKDNI